MHRNPFDIAGALAQGMRTIWVDRMGAGWQDALLPAGNALQEGPTKIVKNSAEIAHILPNITD